MKEPKSWLKPVLELGPVLLFFLVFVLKRGETTVIAGQEYGAFILATLIFIRHRPNIERLLAGEEPKIGRK